MIKILIFDDNAELVKRLTLLLNSMVDYGVQAGFKNLSHLEKNILQYSPDIVLMDIEFPSGNGIEAVRKIKEIDAQIVVIMLTAQEDDRSVFAALKAGADGYLLKNTPPAKLLEYIQEACEGGAPLTPCIARKVLGSFYQVNNNTFSWAASKNLTAREREVLSKLVNGQSYKMVADDLHIAIDTVRSHIRRIYEKLHVNSKTEAVAKAIRNNIV